MADIQEENQSLRDVAGALIDDIVDAGFGENLRKAFPKSTGLPSSTSPAKHYKRTMIEQIETLKARDASEADVRTVLDTIKRLRTLRDETRSSQDGLRAKGIPAFMGKNFLGPEAYIKAFNATVGRVPRLPAHTSMLLQGRCPIDRKKQIRESHILLFLPSELNGEPFTLNALQKQLRMMPDVRCALPKDDWFKDEAFANKALRSGTWSLISKKVTSPSGRGIFQSGGFPDHPEYRLGSIMEMYTALVLYWLENREILFTTLAWPACQEQMPARTPEWPSQSRAIFPRLCCAFDGRFLIATDDGEPDDEGSSNLYCSAVRMPMK